MLLRRIGAVEEIGVVWGVFHDIFPESYANGSHAHGAPMRKSVFEHVEVLV